MGIGGKAKRNGVRLRANSSYEEGGHRSRSRREGQVCHHPRFGAGCATIARDGVFEPVGVSFSLTPAARPLGPQGCRDSMLTSYNRNFTVVRKNKLFFVPLVHFSGEELLAARDPPAPAFPSWLVLPPSVAFGSIVEGPDLVVLIPLVSQALCSSTWWRIPPQPSVGYAISFSRPSSRTPPPVGALINLAEQLGAFDSEQDERVPGGRL
ncbi:hypothetical protein B0H11DRAFT_2232546 [Mycena galericulata]|nr:hypothetical protein B0H11DRAFT_2232546 [Mycena galericulata]